MTHSRPDVKGRFSKADSTAVPAVLIAPHRAEGTVVFHRQDGQRMSGGDFFPGNAKVSISEKMRGQLLLAKSRVVLNVTLFPAAVPSGDARFSFELVDWEPMAQQPRS